MAVSKRPSVAALIASRLSAVSVTSAWNPSSVCLPQALSEEPFMAHFAQALTANVGHVVRELQAVHALSGLHALPEGKRIFTSLAYLVTLLVNAFRIVGWNHADRLRHPVDQW